MPIVISSGGRHSLPDVHNRGGGGGAVVSMFAECSFSHGFAQLFSSLRLSSVLP